MKLSSLNPGEKAVVTKILGHGAFRKRVMEMGFVRGREVESLLSAPLQDPVKYSLMGYEVSLRKTEGDLIEVTPIDEWNEEEISEASLTDGATSPHSEPSIDYKVRKDKEINVALIGNPNCGKTSLFNIAAGAHEHVGNYAGVTVGAKEGSLKYRGYKINLVDLPGTYSLSAYSPEELYVLRYLKQETPDVIVNVVVASNLERNLYLTTELIDMNRCMVIDLNMYDEIEKKNQRLEYDTLGKLLGVPVVPTSASKGRGINQLLDTVIDVYEMCHPDCRHIHVNLGTEIEKGVTILKDEIKKDVTIAAHFSPRYLAIKLLQGDKEIERMLSTTANFDKIKTLRDEQKKRVEASLNEDIESAIASEKYGFIAGALAETMDEDPNREQKGTRIIDAFVTNKLFGFPIFLLLMWLMFWATFEIGAYPMEWIESGISLLSSGIGSWLPDGPLKDILLDGVIGGVGGVIVFLPNILILYCFISFMEDSGYMARVAFIMDKLMHKIGLHGKSFIPLVMGFGCNVPAILSTRIIESQSSRLITILINPFISCSARLPIYVLLIGTFFPKQGPWVFVGLYLLGIVVAIISARLLRRFKFKTDETPFVMELPPYRMPTMKATLRNMWAKTSQYLRKMGGIILVASIIVWALSYFPRQDINSLPESVVEKTLKELPAGTSQADAQQVALTEYQQQNSILGHIGNGVEPVVKPLGFDKNEAIALVAGAAAKEIVVSTLGVIYTGSDSNDVTLSQRLAEPTPTNPNPPFTPLKAITFMVFVLLYFPCLATLTAIYRETGTWRYPVFSMLYNTAVAYLCAFIVYRVGLLLI